MDDKYINIEIGIRRVKVIHFNVNELLFKGNAEKATIDVGIRNEVIPQFNMLNIIMKVVFRYAGSELGAELASIEVNNNFEVINLKNYVDNDGNVLLPETVWISIASMVIGHTRALFADRLAGTTYQAFTIPILDAKAIVERFFPALVVKEKAST